MMEPDEEDTEEQEKIKKLFLIMDFFYYSSRMVRLNSISLKEFHIDVINIEWKDKLKDFYIDWFNCRRGRFNNETDIDLDLEVNEIDKRTFHKVLFIEYPWAFDAANKARLINYDGQISKKKELHNSLDIASILLGGLSPYLKVSVRRDNLIEDSLNSLVSAGANLKKPLKVKFAGEPGVDEGGVQKEFFQLLVKQLFDVGYGMFEYNSESQLFWISRNSFEIPLKFELVGIILGLAIYNNHILDIHLPLAFYKKLLGKRVNLDDFEQYDPQVGKSLRAILNYDKEDFEEVMNLTFTVDYDSWGEKLSKELVENGSEINVTLENKEEYIDKYIHFLMNESVDKYFRSFKEGFEKCCGGEMLPRLEPEDLEMIICGSKVLDFEKLKEATRYHDGYNENSETVKYFWQVVNEFTEEEKKKFLFFTTGCDKAPINGLGELRLTIIRHGDNEELLPSAHTCFNHLLLPCYSSAEKLKEKLLVAINNSEGFGLM